MKKTAILLTVLVLTVSASALQDAYLTMDAKFLNLCVADYEDPNLKACDNQTLVIEGTRDHSLVITPYTNGFSFDTDNATMKANIDMFLDKPLVWIAAVGGSVLTFAFLAIMFGLFVLMLRYVVPR